MIQPTMQVFEQFTDRKGHHTGDGDQSSSRLDTERSSAVFGGDKNNHSSHHHAQNSASTEQKRTEHQEDPVNRPPMFPPSDEDDEDEENDEIEGGETKPITAIADHYQSRKVAVPKAKQKKSTNSRVRKKGDAIIQ